MEGWVYFLIIKGNHYYIGSTINLEKRILEHQMGKTKSLKKFIPVKLIFSKKYDTIKIARQVEYKLKRFKNKSIIERIINDREIKLM